VIGSLVESIGPRLRHSLICLSACQTSKSTELAVVYTYNIYCRTAVLVSNTFAMFPSILKEMNLGDCTYHTLSVSRVACITTHTQWTSYV